MIDQSNPFSQPTLWDTPNATSSQESEAGVSRCDSPDGPTSGQSGPDHAPASRSARPGKAKVKTTRATFGRISFASSPSQDLTTALGNRLVDRMDLDGSLEYTLTWKRVRIASGLLVYVLRAKGRQTSENEFTGSVLMTGWPTPKTPTGGPESGQRKKELGRMESGGGDLASVALLAGWATPNVPNGGRSIKHAELVGGPAYHNGKKVQIGLEAQAKMALSGWSTPRAEDAESAGMRHSRGVADTLTAQTRLAGWNTPTSMDSNRGDYTRDQGNPDKQRLSNRGLVGYPSPPARDWRHANSKPYSERGGGKKGEQLPNLVVHAFGTPTTSSTASTEKPGGSLNPYFSAWLQGYPKDWLTCLPAKASRK